MIRKIAKGVFYVVVFAIALSVLSVAVALSIR